MTESWVSQLVRIAAMVLLGLALAFAGTYAYALNMLLKDGTVAGEHSSFFRYWNGILYAVAGVPNMPLYSVSRSDFIKDYVEERLFSEENLEEMRFEQYNPYCRLSILALEMPTNEAAAREGMDRMLRIADRYHAAGFALDGYELPGTDSTGMFDCLPLMTLLEARSEEAVRYADWLLEHGADAHEKVYASPDFPEDMSACDLILQERDNEAGELKPVRRHLLPRCEPSDTP